MLFFSLRCCFYFIRHFKTIKKLQPFILIVFFSSIESIFNLIFSQLLKKPDVFTKIISHTQQMYLVIEVGIITYFYTSMYSEFQLLKIKSLRAKYISYSIAIVAIIIGFCIDKIELTVTISELVIVNFFFVSVILRNVLHDEKVKFEYQKILNKGIFTFINLITPYSIINELIDQNNFPIYMSLNFINDIGYIIFFNSLYKSCKCYQ